MALDLVALAVSIVVNIVILSPVLWLSGRWLAGSDKAKFSDALWIAILGTVVQAIFGAILPTLGIIGLIVTLIIWLALIRHFFDCGWLKAFAISIVAVIILVVVVVALAFAGLAIGILWF
jgi:hypothetical protein